jgi:N-dimethylarginine dimethylaminohydrolase
MITPRALGIYWHLIYKTNQSLMTYSINQHWDKLNVCAVGSSYPPEFYSFVENSNVRSIMEKISIETEEDYQALIGLLQKHDVKIVRTEIQSQALLGEKLLPPPLSPRDHFAMIGEQFYAPTPARNRKWDFIHNRFYPKNPPQTQEEFDRLSKIVKMDLDQRHNIKSLFDVYSFDYAALKPITNAVATQNNQLILDKNIDSAMTCRIGTDLYFGTWPGQDKHKLLTDMRQEFPEYRCHVVQTDGHLDGVFCPVKPGLILCRRDYIDKIDFATLFPDWEVVPIGKINTKEDHRYNRLKEKNAGRWWVPGEEYNDDFTEFVNSYMDFCVGNIQETTIGVNVLMLDENNLICSESDDRVFRILHSHGITPHVVPVRHHYFWDNGVHCVTCDLDRTGQRKDYFPERR